MSKKRLEFLHRIKQTGKAKKRTRKNLKINSKKIKKIVDTLSQTGTINPTKTEEQEKPKSQKTHKIHHAQLT